MSITAYHMHFNMQRWSKGNLHVKWKEFRKKLPIIIKAKKKKSASHMKGYEKNAYHMNHNV
jgi:hypothetical protein